jgi:hypothetical protein
MPAGDALHLTLDWTDKPPPPTMDFDHARKQSISRQSSGKLAIQDNAVAGASISRPKTSQSMESRPATQGGRKRSGSSASKGSKPTYSLTPAISPATSRRPSLSGADIQKIAQDALAKSNSNASHRSSARPRSNSRTSITIPPPERPAPVPSPARSVLDEVEGTLSATIKELQDLQSDWDPVAAVRPTRMSSLMYRAPSAPEAARSAPPIQEHFTARSYSADSAAAHAMGEEKYPASPAPSVPTTPKSSTVSKNNTLAMPEAPSLGRMQSIQIAYEKSKAAAHKLGVENDTLKQQMKFLRERFAEMSELKSEKETLEVALKEARSAIEASFAELQVSQTNEQATQNNLMNITRRLEEANVQKVDVLGENSDLQDKVFSLEKGMKQMRQEMEELRKRPEASELEGVKNKLSKAEEENKLLGEQAEAAEGRADLPAVVADLSFRLEDLKRAVTEKDKYIEELESQTAGLSKEMEQLREERAKLNEDNTLLRMQSTKSSHKRLSHLEKQIVEIEKSRHAAQQESERHLQLLKEQLRRHANDVHKREHPASNMLEKKLNIEEAIAEIRLKAERRLTQEQNGDVDEEDVEEPETRIAHLEKEVEYHIKDIVLYKLDVKGYRKDLKRAKEKIAALTEAATAAEAAAAAARAQQEARPSISSQSSSTSVPQLSPSVTHTGFSDSDRSEPVTPSIATALQVQMPVRHIVSAWSPGVSPRTTPLQIST